MLALVLHVAILYGTTPQVLNLVDSLEREQICLLWGKKSNELPTKTPTANSGLNRDADHNGLENDYQGYDFSQNTAQLPREVLQRLRRMNRIELGVQRLEQSEIQRTIEAEAIRNSCIVIWPVIDAENLEEGYRYMVEHHSINLVPKGGTFWPSAYQLYVPASLRERVIRRDIPSPGSRGEIILY